MDRNGPMRRMRPSDEDSDFGSNGSEEDEYRADRRAHARAVLGIREGAASSVQAPRQTAPLSDKAREELLGLTMLSMLQEVSQMYTDILKLAVHRCTSKSFNWNLRLLLSTVFSSPVYFRLACDTFMADFTSNPVWKRASRRSLLNWIGFDVPEGVQEEKGIQYEFQMWIRAGDAGQ